METPDVLNGPGLAQGAGPAERNARCPVEHSSPSIERAGLSGSTHSRQPGLLSPNMRATQRNCDYRADGTAFIGMRPIPYRVMPAYLQVDSMLCFNRQLKLSSQPKIG